MTIIVAQHNGSHSLVKITVRVQSDQMLTASWVVPLVMVSTAFATPIKLESKMITLPNPDPGGAACLDGSPYAFYIVPGSSASFSIGIQGGGWCYDEIDCFERSKTALGTSTLWNATSGVGVLNQRTAPPEPISASPV